MVGSSKSLYTLLAYYCEQRLALLVKKQTYQRSKGTAGPELINSDFYGGSVDNAGCTRSKGSAVSVRLWRPVEKEVGSKP